MGIVETREVDPPGRGRGMRAWVGKGKWKVMWWDTAGGSADSGRHDVVGAWSHGVGSLGAAALTALREASDGGGV